ncbi:MAG TPA: Gfo/Idh/MocA family oxidoreductase [Rhodopila sp.]|nr:Gfo/Idh/MocA family oxidoreductase [Rhodopila sp.]
MSVPSLRVGVAGAGHFGRYHALKVATSKRSQLIGVFDKHLERAKTVGWEAAAPAMAFEAMLDASDAIIIAAPAEAHYSLALQALGAGKHVLVEKPIAATLEQADEMGALAAARGLVLQVGHLERFSAAYQAMVGRVQAPLYIEATRIAPFKPRGTDVSVILDLMIHDLDLVLALIDSEIESVDAVGAPVASQHEDIANARLRFRNGAVAAITASRISPRTERRMRIFAQDFYMAADFSARRLTVIGRSGDQSKGQAVPGLPGFGVEDVSWDDHDSLAAEHAAFEASILDGAPVLVNASVGRRALAAALAVGQSMQTSRERMLGSGLIKPPDIG